MNRHDQLYRLYEEFDTDRLRASQEFVDLFPPVDSPVTLEHWENARDELDAGKAEIREAFPETGDVFAEIATRATRDQAFTALDLYNKYDRAVNALVLDVDETLRSAGTTDNEIPRETLFELTELAESGVPIVVCTGQTLENVKGFMIQGLGNELVHSGRLSIVYEAGSGVFTADQGNRTKLLLYEELDEKIRSLFTDIRSRALSDAPDEIRRACHLQGNEFNVTMKPNAQTGSDRARAVIDDTLVYMLDLLADCLGEQIDTDTDPDTRRQLIRAYYADSDPEIRDVLEEAGELPTETGSLPDGLEDFLDRIDLIYYEADAVEIGSLELNKVTGVQAALDVLGIDDPFCLVMGDSKTDLRLMEWVETDNCGIAAAPAHASQAVLAHVAGTDELVYDPGEAAEILVTVATINRLATLAD
jgi:hydroxymethylpyrimidine pyrophosphatase-like HAD family hydrolase